MVVIVLVRKRVKTLDGGIDAFAPQVEPPVDECPVELVLCCVLDNDRPVSYARFAPITGLEYIEHPSP